VDSEGRWWRVPDKQGLCRLAASGPLGAVLVHLPCSSFRPAPEIELLLIRHSLQPTTLPRYLGTTALRLLSTKSTRACLSCASTTTPAFPFPLYAIPRSLLHTNLSHLPTSNMAEQYQYEYFNVSFPAEYVAHVEINRPEKLNAFVEQ